MPLTSLSPTDGADMLAQMELSSGSSEWQLLVAADPDGAATSLKDAIELLGREVVRLDLAPGLDAILAGAEHTTAITLATGVDAWSERDARAFDLARDHVRARIPRLVLISTEEGALRIRRLAPHAADFFATDGYEWAVVPPAELDRDTRLAELRQRWSRSDREVIEAAERGELPAEPDFYVWLVLLDRADLLPGNEPG